jgi:SIR2-like domain
MSTILNIPSEIRSLAQKIGTYSVVPFIGSGCSKALLADNDWNGITNATAKELGLSTWVNLLPTAVAEQFVDEFGRGALDDFLRPRLTLTAFDDALGGSHLALMAMHFMTLYTTNVDNVFELAYAKYGRSLTPVATLADLHQVAPGKAVLYKYHGCLSKPASLVWTSSDYNARRADHDFFLNVRLRSDLLTRTLLFIGYSLRDPHIVELLKRMQGLYADGVRKSIVIAVGDAVGCREALSKEGLDFDVIAPSELYPSLDSALALEHFLSETAKEVYRNYMQSQFDNLFTPIVPQPRIVITEYELALLEQTCDSISLDQAIDLFRGKLDKCLVPQDFMDRVSHLAVKLISRAHDESFDSSKLAGLIFNLCVTSTHHVFVQSYACTLCAKDIDQSFSFFIGLPDDAPTKFLIACTAAEILNSSGIPVNQRFADWVAGPLRVDKTDFDSLSTEQQASVKPAFERIFSQSQRDNPITTVMPRLPGHRTKTQMLEQMLKSLPQHLRQPIDPR